MTWAPDVALHVLALGVGMNLGLWLVASVWGQRAEARRHGLWLAACLCAMLIIAFAVGPH